MNNRGAMCDFLFSHVQLEGMTTNPFEDGITYVEQIFCG